MELNLSDVRFEYIRGTGPGGQHKNKTCTAVRATHIPTGIQAFIQDSRSQYQNKRKALEVLRKKLAARKADKIAQTKKKRRDYQIHNTKTVRTYDFQRGTVKDHRSGKIAPLKEVLVKGHIELVCPQSS